MFSTLCVWYDLQVPKAALEIPPDVQQKQAARGHQGPAGDIPLYPGGKGHRPHSPGEDKWDDTGSALPKHAFLEEKGRKRNPQI